MSQIVIQHYQQPMARRRLWIGLVIAAIGVAYALQEMVHWLQSAPHAQAGLSASLVAGVATGLGALPILLIRRPSDQGMAPLLGVAGGMMLAASLFSLLVPAFEHAAKSDWPAVSVLIALAALGAGALMMQQLDRAFAHNHLEDVQASSAMPSLALVVIAVALHNVPEGLAVGIASASGVDRGMTLGIALQNLPEGWIVASALAVMGVRPGWAVLAALGTGLMEPLGGLLGVLAHAAADTALPIALAGAAGAMLWVVLHELLPAARRRGQLGAGLMGTVAGFAAMTVLALLA